MIWGGSRARVFVYRQACDIRRSFSGLSRLVREQMRQDRLSGHYLFFINGSKNYIKQLTWDGAGYCLRAKKLPKGGFSTPNNGELLLQECSSVIESPIEDMQKSSRGKKDQYIPK